MFNYLPGHNAPAAWTPQGGVPTVLNIKESTVDISCLLHDVTNTGTLGVRARLAGPLDVAGNIMADVDLDQTPWSPVLNIKAGNKGLVAFGYTPTDFLQVPVSVEKFHSAVAVDKDIMYNFDVKCNALVGLIVYPPL